MANKCAITGKIKSVGRNVSHSNRKTLRCFKPNMTVKKIFNPKTGKVEKMLISAKGLKTLQKRMK